MTRRLPRLSLDAYEQGVRNRDRALLAQAITLIESRDAEDAALAQALLTRLLPFTGAARRVGITGVPGVGKSTFVDELGMRLLGQGKQVAVLAIDPSSTLSGGSTLGDKTRMARLSLEARAFIRPSPSGLSPGGITRRTRETMPSQPSPGPAAQACGRPLRASGPGGGWSPSRGAASPGGAAQGGQTADARAGTRERAAGEHTGGDADGGKGRLNFLYSWSYSY